MNCKNCGLPIKELLDPWGGKHGYYHPTVEREVNIDGVDVMTYATSCPDDLGEARTEACGELNGEEKQAMTDQEIDAQLGKIMRELTRVRGELSRSKVQAAQMADRFEELAKILKENPGIVFFSSDPIPGAEHSRHKTIFEVEDFDGRAVQKIAASIRELESRRKELEQRLASLGYPQ